MRGKALHRITVVAALVTATWLGISCFVSPMGHQPTPMSLGPNGINIEEWTLFGEINTYRGQNNLSAVVLSRKLSNCAADWSRQMADQNNASHQSRQWWQSRLQQESYPCPGLNDSADIICGSGQTPFSGETAQEAINAWKNSPAHRDVILERGSWSNANWKAVGIGQAYNSSARTWFWTVVFGKYQLHGDSIGSADDGSKPSANITSPPNGSTVSGTVTIEASASDGQGIAFVEFYLNPQSSPPWTPIQSTDYTSPYRHSWDSSNYQYSYADWGAKAYDNNGNTQYSAIIRLYVTTSTTADLAVTKVDSPDPVAVGSNLTYTLAVTNNGPAVATGVTLTDTLPAGVIFVSATSSQGSCSQAGGTVTCNLGSLNSGATATVTIIVTPTTVGTITNTATVTGNEADPNPANNNARAQTTVSGPTNRPPSVPSVPSGPTQGYAGISYGYSTWATDPDNDQVSYTFDWGDGTMVTTALGSSGWIATEAHSWSSAGDYDVKVMATDEHGATSAWSSPLKVHISAAFPPVHFKGTVKTDEQPGNSITCGHGWFYVVITVSHILKDPANVLTIGKDASVCYQNALDLSVGESVEVHGHWPTRAVIPMLGHVVASSIVCPQVGKVKFTGSVTSNEAYGAAVCYGSYYVNVTINQIVRDMRGLLTSGIGVQICYKNPLNLTVGESVEVYGYYWKQAGPMQLMGRVQAFGDSYYVIRNTGTIIVNATLDGSRWSRSIKYELIGPTVFKGSSAPQTFSVPPGTWTLHYASGGPAGAIFMGVSPSPTQTVGPGGTITFTLNFVTPPGVIEVRATLNGLPWSGSLIYYITGPVSGFGLSVPSDFPNSPPGSYTLTYHSGGPKGAPGVVVMFEGITPSATQNLTPGSTITFYINFRTWGVPPPPSQQ